jgi:GT2 family glycosyltransferase
MSELTAQPGARCAVIIPTYEGAALTRSCLEALLAHPPATCTWELIVVDDASTDSTHRTLAGYGDAITVVIHSENVGFATACNSGAGAAEDCDYLVFLNNDTIPIAGWLDALVEQAASTPAAAAVGAKLLFPNGSIQHAGVTIAQDGWPRHLYAGFPGEHPAVNRSRAVAAVTGACLLVKREDFDELGGFDSAFHNGYEDVDLCLRLRETGREVWYCARSVLYHLESVTRWPTSQPQDTGESERLYEQRWRGRIAPDDVHHYFDDGLLQIEYGAFYPFKLAVSPHLAAVRQDAEELAELERVLSARSQQVMDLLASQTRALLRDRMDVHVPALAQTSGPSRAPDLVTVGSTHQLGGPGGHHRVSLLLPVKNQERDVRELLGLVLGQAVSVSLEIIAVDSGSQDGTVDALREFEATVIAIDPSDFNHGLTRNLAAQHAAGDVLLFLTPSSRPLDNHWLAPLLAVLDEDPQAAGVCSRVIPHRDADILTRKDGERELSGSADRTRKVISDWNAYRQMSVEQRRAFLNFHTVSAALRAEVFAQIPFRAVTTLGEDLLWAREVEEAGWSLWHEPASTVYHSHQYTLEQLFARNVDDGLANNEINDRVLAEKDVVPAIRALVADDWTFLRDTLGLRGEDLDRLQVDSTLRRVAQVMGQWLGANHREMPPEVVAFFSGVNQARGNNR